MEERIAPTTLLCGCGGDNSVSAGASAQVDAGASAVWLQQGIRSTAGRELCREAGVLYVEDHCMAVDYIRLDIAGLRSTA